MALQKRPRADNQFVTISKEDWDKGLQEHARRGSIPAIAGRAPLRLALVLLALVPAVLLVWWLAQTYTSLQHTLPDLLSTLRFWLTYWRLLRFMLYTTVVLVLAVVEGVEAWQGGVAPVAIAAGIVIVLVQEYMWYRAAF